jgi:hypothetical protein
MHLYIDKENLLSFIKQSKKPLYQECLRTMQRQVDITFNFSKADLRGDQELMNLCFRSGIN